MLGSSDYDGRIAGGGLYATFNPREHYGVELDIRQANSSDGLGVYQRTYEIGGRYVRQYGALAPYGKVMIGRGVFNYPKDAFGNPTANLAYNMFAVGAGVDYSVRAWLNVRADFEYQKWVSFQPNGLSPKLLTIGAAYHFKESRR